MADVRRPLQGRAPEYAEEVSIAFAVHSSLSPLTREQGIRHAEKNLHTFPTGFIPYVTSGPEEVSCTRQEESFCSLWAAGGKEFHFQFFLVKQLSPS